MRYTVNPFLYWPGQGPGRLMGTVTYITPPSPVTRYFFLMPPGYSIGSPTFGATDFFEKLPPAVLTALEVGISSPKIDGGSLGQYLLARSMAVGSPSSSVPLLALVFPPNVSGTLAILAADFAGNQYWAAGTEQPSFTAWLSALGGTFSRASPATYLDRGMVKTAAANTPRFPTDINGAPQGIRLTGPATNLMMYSNDFVGAWQPVNATVTASATAGPDGVDGSGSIVIPSTLASSIPQHQRPSTVASGSFISSIFAKAAGYNFAAITAADASGNRYGVVADLVSGVITSSGTAGSPTGTSSGAIKLANGWVLIWVAMSSPAGTASLCTGACPVANPSWNTGGYALPDFTGDGVSGVYLFGGQVTQTPFLCDYVPTTAATVTQAADAFSLPFTQTTFSALVGTNDLKSDRSGNQRVLAYNTGDGIIIIGNTSFATIVPADGSGLFMVMSGLVISDSVKTMVVGDHTTGLLTSNGAVPPAPFVSGPITVVTPASMFVGSQSGTSNFMNGNISQLAIWNGIVASAAEMQRLTT